MCEDFGSDYSDVSDSSAGAVDDVNSDFEDVSLDINDIGAEDFSFDEVSDDSFDLDDSIEFDDSFEMDDMSDDFEIDLPEEIETLELDDEIETLEIDDSKEDVETLELNDSADDIAESFETTEETEQLSIDNLDQISADVEISEIDDLSNESIEEDIDDVAITDDDFQIDELSNDMVEEITEEEIKNNDSNSEVGEEHYQAKPLSEIQTINENGNIDSLENIIMTNINDESLEIDDVEPYEAVPNSGISNLQEGIENAPLENDVELDNEIEVNETVDVDNIIETDDLVNEETISSGDLEQALRDDAVDNAPLTDTVYEDDSEFNDNIENEIPQMTDEELEEFVNWENQHNNANYEFIEEIMNDDSLTDDQKEFMIQQLLNEIQEGENEVTEYGQRVKGLTYDGRDIITKPDDVLEQNEQIDDTFNGELTESDIDAVYEGLESYDFQDVDCFEDIERLDSSLESFTSENWEQLSLDEQKEKMTDLAEYIIDVTGLENPPHIEFYNNEQEGDYGGFNRMTNTLSINEHMLYQNDEAADTVAHELWHALQYQRASNPRTKLDAMYAENFNDYISPEEDFEGYQSQILESEARAFAQQIKDRLHSY